MPGPVRHAVYRVSSRTLRALMLGALLTTAAQAQRGVPGDIEPAPVRRVLLAVGGSALPIGVVPGSNNSVTVLALTGGIEQRVAARTSVQLRVRLLSPTSTAVAIPSCVPGFACQTISSPDRLTTASVHLTRYSWKGSFSVSLGTGVIDATGVQPGPRRSLISDVGFAWRPVMGNRAALVVGVHAVLLQRRVSDMRAMVLPTLGIAF